MASASRSIPLRRAALRVVEELRAAGHIACFAGGCVRDELLDLEPTDYDVATDATPPRVEALFSRTQSVGASFGVVLVRIGGVSIEVATFRADGPYSDSRRPDAIRFSDPCSDAHRRDFTINALFLDPYGEGEPGDGSGDGASPIASGGAATIRKIPGGRVIDFVGGLDDLAKRVVRAVGDPDRRLAEDHLRALRAVRLVARLGFELDRDTGEAIRRHARELRGVSRERIGDEIRKMLLHPSRVVAAWTLQTLGLDEPVLGQPTRASAPTRLGRLPDEALYALCLAAWALDRGCVIESTQIKPLVLDWRRGLCLSNDERSQLGAILAGHAVLDRSWWSLGAAAQKRAAAAAWFEDALRLIAAENSEGFVRISRRVSELRATASGLKPNPVVSGDDLIRAGLKPGPDFRQLLDRVYDAQLEDRITTRAEGLELARELAGD